MKREDSGPVLHDTAVLAANLRAPGQARAKVGLACVGWAVSHTDTAQLLVSELVTNALLHGKGDIELHILRDDRVLRVTVGDARTAVVAPVLGQHMEAERGRGLLIVEALATSWGTCPGTAAGSKSVWFEVTRAGAI